MEIEDIMFKLRGYLEEQNYVAACLFLKNEELPDGLRYEATGEVAKRVIDDLASEKNKEKMIYLRSILVWLFKDIPGLASVYREQLRLASDNPNIVRDFMRGVRTFTGAATAGGSETLGDRVDDLADNLRPEVIQEKVKDFFSDAGLDIDDGIRKAQDFFDTLAGGRQGGERKEPGDVDSDE